MKIGIVCYPTHGGSGVVASELAVGLAQRGHEIHIVSYATPFRLGGFSENIYIHEVEVASYPLFRYPPYGMSLATTLAEIHELHKLDIVHAHYAVPHAASAVLAREILRDKKLKVITTLHGTDITLVGADKSFFRIIKFSMEESDGVTAVSRYLREKTFEEFNIARDIEVIYNFIDTSRCNEKQKQCMRDRYAPNGEKILMHASNFRPVKRVGDVIRIFEKVRRQIPAKLILVGEGPERLFVQQLTKDLKVKDDVHFLGTQDYIEQVLNCADLFLLPSEQESFGLVALEAHSCGVPVVGSDTGGLPEVVSHGETGFLAPVGETTEMAKRSLEILCDDALNQSFRHQARERAVTCFDREKILPQYEAFYEKILGL
jgi:N-acetyl-alpha-D-glucosaminyl L-malate synthase BshA